jgi:hypothetical protein
MQQQDRGAAGRFVVVHACMTIGGRPGDFAHSCMGHQPREHVYKNLCFDSYLLPHFHVPMCHVGVKETLDRCLLQ